MEIQKLSLPGREWADVDDLSGSDSHLCYRWLVGDRRDDQLPIVFEPDKAPVKQVVNRRREQQPVLAVQPLLVRRVASRFAVARDQVHKVRHAGNSTGSLIPSTGCLKSPWPRRGRMIASASAGPSLHQEAHYGEPRIPVGGSGRENDRRLRGCMRSGKGRSAGWRRAMSWVSANSSMLSSVSPRRPGQN